MTTNRKWVPKEQMHLMRSSNGAVWFCKKCMHIMPYDEARDSDDARKDKQHKRIRHHFVYAEYVPNMVTVGVPGMYYLDGTIVKSEAEILEEARAKMKEHIVLDEALWLTFVDFAEKYKTENRSITYYECVKCYKVTELEDVLNPKRVFHCNMLASIVNKNIKQWFDATMKTIDTESESYDPFKSLRSK